MKNIFYLMLCVLFIFCFSTCKHKTKQEQLLDDGRLLITEYVNDSINYVKIFYQNGNLHLESFVKYDSIVEGKYREYYPDGTLWWEGEYKNSELQSEYKKDWTWDGAYKYLKGIEKKENPRIGQPYKFRIVMPEIHPYFYMVTDEDFNVLQNTDDDADLYPWVYTPTEKGEIILQIVFRNKDGFFIVGNPMINFTTDTKVEW
jgi:hypothetical protein